MRRTAWFLILIIIGVNYFLSATTPQAQAAPEPAPQSLSPPAIDPVASLKPHLARLQNYTSSKRRYENVNAVWVEWYTMGDLRYDVRRTDSLVAPVVAYLTFSDWKYTVNEKVKISTVNWKVGVPEAFHDHDCKVTLAMQDGKWVMTDARSQLIFTSGDKDDWKVAGSELAARIEEALGLGTNESPADSSLSSAPTKSQSSQPQPATTKSESPAIKTTVRKSDKEVQADFDKTFRELFGKNVYCPYCKKVVSIDPTVASDFTCPYCRRTFHYP